MHILSFLFFFFKDTNMNMRGAAWEQQRLKVTRVTVYVNDGKLQVTHIHQESSSVGPTGRTRDLNWQPPGHKEQLPSPLPHW